LEELAAAYFAARGWLAKNGTLGADGGVDVRLRWKEGPERRGYVQCKAFDQPAGVKVVREFFGVMAADGVGEGWLIATGGFTAEAQAFAMGKPLHLVDAQQLVALFAELPEP